MSEKKKAATPDWERIGVQYRAGLLSLREIAGEHGISHVAVQKKAKKEGWERDLRSQIQAKADALVNRQVVTAAVTAERLETEKQVVDASAQAIADVKLRHRENTKASMTLAMEMLGELRLTTHSAEELRRLAEILADGADAETLDAARRSLEDLLKLHNRVTSMQRLADVVVKLNTQEKRDWGITDGTEGGGGSYEDFLRSLST